MARYLENEYKLPEPSIRLTVNTMLTEEDMLFTCDVLSKAFEHSKAKFFTENKALNALIQPN